MILDDVHRGIRKRKKRKRVGRGPGSGHGKTAGRGHKGYGSRAGASRRRGFEGGQMPLFRRMAKRGFNNRAFADVIEIVNVATLEKIFETGDTVNLESLREKGLAKGRFDQLKILGQGELTKSLTVSAQRFSKSAIEKIEAAGGTADVIETK
ncbi:MAG: 50S ribosomal protein L15 [Pirellulaceae bacterium]|nr:50S ribosomal protein L15 [Pirellulaceae bacterium]